MPRKLRMPGVGEPVPALTQLKRLSADNRARVMNEKPEYQLRNERRERLLEWRRRHPWAKNWKLPEGL